MQLRKNTSKGGVRKAVKILIQLILVIFVLFLFVKLIDKVNLPVPNKKIEKIIPNENFKTLK